MGARRDPLGPPSLRMVLDDAVADRLTVAAARRSMAVEDLIVRLLTAAVDHVDDLVPIEGRTDRPQR